MTVKSIWKGFMSSLERSVCPSSRYFVCSGVGVGWEEVSENKIPDGTLPPALLSLSMTL